MAGRKVHNPWVSLCWKSVGPLYRASCQQTWCSTMNGSKGSYDGETGRRLVLVVARTRAGEKGEDFAHEDLYF